MPRQRRRKSLFPRVLSIRVAEDMAQLIEGLADARDTTLGEIARHALDMGLPLIKDPGPSVEVSSSDPRARDWWAGLDQPKRRAWGRRLSDLRGPSFLVEAYRQAGTPETE